MKPVEVRIEGHLDPQWAEWLDGFTLTHNEQGETILTGSAADQSVFYGMIAKLRDLGVRLIAVRFGGVPYAKE